MTDSLSLLNAAITTLMVICRNSANFSEGAFFAGARLDHGLRAEQAWMSLFRILGSRPDGIVQTREANPATLRATGCDYPSNPASMYTPFDDSSSHAVASSAARTTRA